MIRVIFNVLLILGVGYVITQVVNFYLSINSGKGQTRNDIAELKSKIATYLAALVPMNDKELELLSINADKNVQRSGMTILKYGAFNSIYQEPLLAYAFKEYKYPADRSILLISTDKDDFTYMTKGASTQVFLNDDEIGYIDPSGNLYDPEKKKVLAHIEMENGHSSHTVQIEGREVGEIVNARKNESPNPRAYQFLEEMSAKESNLFKALTFLSLVEESIG